MEIYGDIRDMAYTDGDVKRYMEIYGNGRRYEGYTEIYRGIRGHTGIYGDIRWSPAATWWIYGDIRDTMCHMAARGG